MNPYLKRLREKYEALRSGIETIQTRAVNEDRDLTEDELRSIGEQSEQAKSLYAEIEPLAEEETRSRKVAELAVSLMGPDGQIGTQEAAPAADAVPPLMPSRAQLDQMRSAINRTHPTPMRLTTTDRAEQQNRAVVTLAADAGAPVSALGARALPEPRRIATAAGLITERVAGVEGTTFPVFGAGSAGTAAENVLKPEYDNIAPGTATPQMISVWTDYTRQLALSHGTFENRLRQKLARLVAAQEDQLVQAKVMATAGIQTQAFVDGSQANAVLIGAAKVQDAVGQAPDLALVNPNDLGLLLGAGLANTPPGELAELSLNLFGMILYPTSAQTAGFVLVGAWAASSRLVVGMDPTYYVDPYSGLKNNKVTTLLEEGLDLAVEEPAGFISIDIITP